VNIQWRDLTRNTLDEYASYVHFGKNYGLSDYSLVTMMLWTKPMLVKYAVLGETLFIRLTYISDKEFILLPFSKGDLERDLKQFIEMYPNFSFNTIPAELTGFFRTNYPDKYDIVEIPIYADYVYLTENISSCDFCEKIDHSFRPAYLHRMYDEHKIDFRVLNSTNVAEAKKFVAEAYGDVATQNEYLRGEMLGIDYLFANYDIIPGCEAGILYIDNEPDGVIITGKISPDMYDISFIKNSHKIRGSAIILLHEAFSHFSGNCKYYNYQEDLGIPGLHRFKTSLGPVEQIKKYAVIKK